MNVLEKIMKKSILLMEAFKIKIKKGDCYVRTKHDKRAD